MRHRFFGHRRALFQHAAMGPLILSPQALQSVDAHATKAYPSECCGLLLGTRDGGALRAEAAFPVKNLAADQRNDRYVMEASDRLRGETEARARGLAVIGFYHSHPDHDAYFSPTDLAGSEEVLMGEPWLPPTYAYLVVSVKNGKSSAMAGFYIEQGDAHELPVQFD